VDLATMIAMYTINAAYQNHLERETGSIEVGKLADLVVLDRNLFDARAQDIHSVRVLRTLLQGRTVFKRDPVPPSLTSSANQLEVSHIRLDSNAPIPY
jgi:predicted amidohydrolase YtcJ